jgi:pimeloyl-ACP methyl ester carboxylesterase
MHEQRLFVPLADRLAHVRILGSGPPVLLVHGSPQSGRAVVPLMQAVARAGGTAIAPDTPGNGWSTPLPGAKGAAAFADALGEVAGALGLGPLPVYGFHTGAVLAAELALRQPGRVGALLLDGVPCFDATERADFERHYFRPFEPVPDGSHMAWAWMRIEDQSWFFPWYRPGPQTWMAHGVVATARIHANVMDFLLAPNQSAAPYKAAFGWDAGALSRLEAHRRVWITAAPGDPLAGHFARLPALSGARIAAGPDNPDQRLAAMASWLVDQARAGPQQALRIQDQIQSGPLRYVAGPYGPVVVHLPQGAPRTARLLPWSRSVRHWSQLAPNEVLIERPGHGASAPVPAGAVPLADRDYARLILEQADYGDLPVAGADHSCPPLPDLTPVWDGTHLLRAWRLARRQALFQDWQAPAYATRCEPGLLVTLEMLQHQAVDLLLAAEALKAARPPQAAHS